MRLPGILLQNKTESLFAQSSKSIILFVLFLLISLPGKSQDRKILLIGIDGLLPEAVGLPETSNINALYENETGFLTYGYTEDLTFSGPSWSSILHGVHRARHGVDTNEYDGHDFSEYPNLFKRLKDHNPDLHTSAFVTWSLLQNNFQRPDGSSVGVDALVYHPREKEGDQRVTEDLVELLKTGDPDAVFYYQNDIDKAGHGYGFSIDIPEYREQLHITDARIGQVLDALKNRPGITNGQEEWLIVLVTDHGGVGTAHSGNLYRQRFIPLIFSRYPHNREGGVRSLQAVRRLTSFIRPRNVDVARAVLSFMGVSENKFSELDGYNILNPDYYEIPEAGYNTNLIVNGDGEFDRGFASREFDQAISGWHDQEHTGQWDGHHSVTLIKAPGNIKMIGSGGEINENQLSGNLFTGGRKGLSGRMTQRIDLNELREDIDSRSVFFLLSGYLGGTAGSEDRMEITVTFLNKTGDPIDTTVLEPVTRQDRENETALIYREAKGFVSPGTVSAMIELHATGTTEETEGIHALADQLSLVLTRNNN